MRAFVILAAVTVLAAGCNPPPAPEPAAQQQTAPPRDARQDAEEVVAAHRALVEAYQKADSAAFAEMLDASPQLLVFHPFVQNRFDGIDEARDRSAAMFARLGQSQWTDVHSSVLVEGDVAWFTSQILIEAANLERPFVGRGTEIWVRRDAAWRLAHAHWSADPESASAN